jgi:proteasome lid subunit RPN8/RPN11
MVALILPRSLRAQIEGEARDAFPRECCGLMEGRRSDDTIHVIALYAARNLSVDTDRFEIDPADHFPAQRMAREKGHALVGCYHSHPNGVADISERDRKRAMDDGFVWLVCAVEGKDTRIGAFVRENGQFNTLELREIPTA